jgi:hypothetical protein
MGFTIITTVSPDFREAAERVFFPTWRANAGADEIVVHPIDKGQWHKNIAKRADILTGELCERTRHRERVLSLDADCLILNDLSEGFSPEHAISVARWPHVNMGVAFFNLARQPWPFRWRRWLAGIRMQIHGHVLGGHTKNWECDQVIWRPKLHQIAAQVYRLAEWEWNYNEFDLPQWKRELPKLRDITRVVHIKGHGDWGYAQLDAKVAYLKELWPKELACIA